MIHMTKEHWSIDTPFDVSYVSLDQVWTTLLNNPMRDMVWSTLSNLRLTLINPKWLQCEILCLKWDFLFCSAGWSTWIQAVHAVPTTLWIWSNHKTGRRSWNSKPKLFTSDRSEHFSCVFCPTWTLPWTTKLWGRCLGKLAAFLDLGCYNYYGSTL